MTVKPRDDWRPLDLADSARQVRGLIERLGESPRRILDLGCGDGRVLAPLADAGHDVIGVDSDPAAIDACRRRLQSRGRQATLLQIDFLRDWRGVEGDYDHVLCLGNTFMTVHDVDAAADLFERVVSHLRPAGSFVIDDFPHEMWREIASGNWQAGISEDGEMQLVFAPGEPVFALRRGGQVDESSWSPGPDEPLNRLWSMGDLRLLARLSGLEPPEHLPAPGLIEFRRREG